MTNGTNSGGLPTWAKILIGIVAVGIVAFVGLFIAGVLIVQNYVKKAQDPAAMAKVTGIICDIPAPLPAAYKMTAGFSLAGINTVSFRHDPDGQLILLMSYPKVEGDAQAVVDAMAQKGAGIPQTSTSSRMEEIKGRGNEKVGGETMPYIIGVTADRGNTTKHDTFVGCVIPSGKTKTVFVIGAQPTGSYNLKETEDFLAYIKSFK